MNILIVDDHSLIRDGVRRLLSSAKLSPVATPWQFISRKGRMLSLLDQNFGSSSGLEFLRRLLGEHAGARVLIFSMY